MRKRTLPIPRRPLLSFTGFSLSTYRLGFWSEKGGTGSYVTSGRAAIFHALRLLGVEPGESVLVPTYHCPTLVAPVVALRATPLFYPLTEERLPDLGKIDSVATRAARAILVPQLFGIPQDLAQVRAWCDERKVPMVEDCAHSIAGKAGSREVGQWGDFATASLTKFLPVGELGWLWSSAREVPNLHLQAGSLRTELKAVLDPLEIAAEHGRLGLLGAGVSAVSMHRRRSAAVISQDPSDPIQAADGGRWSENEAMAACDMGRVGQRAAFASRLIAALSDLPEIAARRRRNFRRMSRLLDDLSIGKPLIVDPPDDCAPYALPVFVDDAQALYPAMRAAGFPVFRWDRLWPGTPSLEGDVGSIWSRHLLQVPVHQSYTDTDFDRMAAILEDLRHL